MTPRSPRTIDFEPLLLGMKKTASRPGVKLTARCCQLASRKLAATVGPIPK